MPEDKPSVSAPAHDVQSASDLRWRIAIESSKQGVWDYDLVSGARYLSAIWKTMRGLPADYDVSQLQGDWLDRVHPDDRERVKAYVARQNSGELVEVAYDYRERHLDGHYVWILARGRCVEWTPDGKLRRIVGTDTDITELKAAEEELRLLADSEMRWKIAVESAKQGLWDHDHVTGAKFFSGSWYDMRGLPRGHPTPTGQGWLSRIHPDDHERVLNYIKRQDSGEIDQISYEFRERHEDGHWMWILSRGRPVTRDANGLPTRLIGTDTDITQLKTSEEAAKQLSLRLELALSTSRVGVWEVDIESNQVQWDARMRELYGLGRDAELPRDVWEQRLHPEDRDTATSIAYKGARDHAGYMMDFRIVLPSGEVRHIRCRASYFEDLAMGPKLIGVNWDVTADHRRTEELEQANQRTVQQNEDLEVARAQMEFISLHDALTMLPNRRLLDMRLKKAEQASSAGRRIAVLHIDLDRFKQINDTLGHAAGDAVLVSAATTLKRAVGDGGLVARVGGDEFVILIENAPSDVALGEVADRIIAQMFEPVQYLSHACRCGVSIGVAVSTGQRLDTRKLLIDADIALYKAKKAGRNRYSFFNAEMQVEVIATKRCADEILTGLERGEFFPVYQPQFDASTRAVVGVEALARWRHPTRGVLPPSEFLRVAEDLGAVSRIDRMMLEQSLADMAVWRQQGLGIPRVSVNVSAPRLREEDLIANLKMLEFPRNTLSFELLESMFLDEQDDLVAWNIDQIRELGIGIDIDDFGTGHASIVGLLSLRPDRLKIDRQLVEPIVESARQRRLLASIVEIGKSQGIKVLAEGVETMEHARILAELGCDSLQGYGFARPMPAALIPEFILGQRRKAG